MAIKIKDLTRLRFRQLYRGKSKSWLYSNIGGIVWFWVIEAALAIGLNQGGVEIPALAGAIVIVCCLIPDFILKLILEKDNTVMDAFLKTRPLSQETWDRFLSISQFWKASNLLMPLYLAPACFLFLPFTAGMILLVFIYLASVFGGFLVMLFKHRGTYQTENLMNSVKNSSVKSVKGNYVSRLVLRSYKRSKRLKTSIIYLGILMYLQCICHSLSDGRMASLMAFLFIFLISCTFTMNGFAVEANFFEGIWSRPIAIEELFKNKYRLGFLSGSVAVLLCTPLCVWGALKFMDIVSSYLFCAGLGNLAMLINAYDCVPIDLFGRTFYNSQGSKTSFNGITLVITFVVMIIGYALLFLLPGLKAWVILSALGIIAICIHNPVISLIKQRFLKNRYKYLEKYLSK